MIILWFVDSWGKTKENVAVDEIYRLAKDQSSGNEHVCENRTIMGKVDECRLGLYVGHTKSSLSPSL